ncbi:diguanylate cyclase [Methylotenera mobilis]|uniref:diguanylate cyclase n=1 Tax=Methylotenera mobilis TaxID=359408 RepID=UPI00037F46CD|nr:diguanylate cyclase [Methylotenera mobilis]PPC97163.1 MAG: GGDEF domain-containing protein [Methylotenera sp.]PPD47745.1 MAG: GGDEF domain-containing protein [Methylotenera sp.]
MLKLNFSHKKLDLRYRFALALLLFSLALAFRFTILPQGGGGPFVTFYPAIILSFYFCGAYLGLLVALCAGLAGAYYFIPPYHQFSIDATTYSSLIFFSITSGLVGFFISRLHRHIEEISIILDNEMIGGMMLKDRKIVWCNTAVSRILGYPPSMLLGSSTKMLFADEKMFDTVGRDAYPLKVGKPYRTQFEMKKVDGSKIWIDISGAAISYDKHLSLWLLNDISKQKTLEDELKHKVNHDYLTGLNSRDWFMNQALIELNRANRFSSPLSLLMLDIDFFKTVNDTHGHQVGDIALKSVADIAKSTLRDFDICARLGGEEFAVLLPETNKSQAYEVAERLRLAIENSKVPLPSGGLPLTMTISIGVSSMTSKDDNIDVLISKADKALYEAKKTGRNKVCASQ